jgi:hypothetical protein
MTPDVIIESATDPEHVENPQVWYSVEYNGRQVGERSADYLTINARAWDLVKEHDGVLVDRSDKQSGNLRASLER